MRTQIIIKYFTITIVLSILLQACQSLTPDPTRTPLVEVTPTEEPPATIPPQSGFPDVPAIPNDSSIEGVQTFPDKNEYHNHVAIVTEPEGPNPPVFGAHLSAWQNCGIYDQPVGLGNALHSLEHGAVWLTYSPYLSESQIVELRKLVRGHGYVLMSPYAKQKKPVVLTAWGVQLVIDSLPDDRIAKFIAYYELGPQNPEPGAPCSGAIGIPLP